MAEQTWTPEEQKEHRKLWVEALRSGKYQQARGVLRDETGSMCCLGVACEISGLGGWLGDEAIGFGDDAGALRWATLTFRVQEWLGLADEAGGFGYNALSAMNDEGKPFAEIADIIEAEPAGLIAEAV